MISESNDLFVSYRISDYAGVQGYYSPSLMFICNSILFFFASFLKAGVQMTADSHPAPLRGRTFRHIGYLQVHFQK